jgi:drug/metabolite transporter (DMT)-like permease
MVSPNSTANSANSPHDPTDRLGIALSLTAAIGFGFAVAFARYAYDGGTNGFTLASLRACFATFVLLVICRATGRDVCVGARDWLQLTGLGLLISILFYGNVGAVEFISVGLTALLVFTSPIVTAVLQAILDRTLPAPAKVLALLVAFAGLFLMLGVSFVSSDPRGIALALAAGIAAAGNAVWYGRTMRHLDIVVATLHMTVAAMVSVGVLAIASGECVLPVTASGWGGFAAVVLLQSLGAPIYFAAIRRIGAVKAGVLSNIQPLTSIVAAYLLFGELLSGAQLAGGALVIAGIVLMQRHDAQAAPARIARRAPDG